MLNHLSAASAFLVLCIATPVLADEIELDWNSVELGFFEKATDAGYLLHGLAVYVPGNRVATEDDFYAIIPEFCSSRFEGLLAKSLRIDGAPNVSLLKLQVDFYGPKIGENQTYIAQSATIDLEDGKCSL